MPRLPSISIPPQLKSILPKVLVGVLLLLNGAYVVSKMLKSDIPELWQGPVMLGKHLPLPSRPELAAEAAKPKVKEEFAASEPLKDVMEEQKAVKRGEGKVAKKAAADKAFAELKEGYLVLAGSFELKMGAETLMERLKKNSMLPRYVEQEEMVQLNDVQAGPYLTLEEAKVAEAKLKAGGLAVKAVETWEGYIISLGKHFYLGYAVEAMDRAEKLAVSPMRLVKVESALKMQKVYLGPYPTQDAAREVGVRLTQLGLSAKALLMRTSDVEREIAETKKKIESAKAAAGGATTTTTATTTSATTATTAATTTTNAPSGLVGKEALAPAKIPATADGVMAKTEGQNASVPAGKGAMPTTPTPATTQLPSIAPTITPTTPPTPTKGSTPTSIPANKGVMPQGGKG